MYGHGSLTPAYDERNLKDKMKDTDSLDGETSQGTAPSTSKRALLKSAWVAPLVIAVTLPRSGYAANISGNGGAI